MVLHIVATQMEASVTQVDDSRIHYSCFGHSALSGRLGFCGEIVEIFNHVYMLGNGARVYSSVLSRFVTPDELSPFSQGGVNAYAYCGGDPLNKIDPSGRFSIPLLGRLGYIWRISRASSMRADPVVFFGDGLAAGLARKKVFYVHAHGSPGYIKHGGTDLSPSELALMIRGNPNTRSMLQEARRVQLIACHGADPGPNGLSFGRQLAVELQMPVTAYPGKAHTRLSKDYERYFYGAAELYRSYKYTKPSVYGSGGIYKRKVFRP